MENFNIILGIMYILQFIIFFYVLFVNVDLLKHKQDIDTVKDDVNTFVVNTCANLQCNLDKLHKDLQKCKRDINKLKK